MSAFPLPVGRALLVAGLTVLTLTACGRRGAPEAPPDPSAKAAASQAGSEGIATPTPTARSKAQRGYTIPNRPFILDPLL